MWTVYILRCADGTYYTGVTNKLPERLKAHNDGKGAKYTKARRPVELIYSEPSENRSTASKREYAIKQLSRAQKQTLTADGHASEPKIQIGNLDDENVQALLAMHLQDAYQNSPPDSVHALDLSALRANNISFWTMYDGNRLMGCGALKMLDATHGEIKTMRTHPLHLRRGVGAQIVEHIIDEAKRCNYARLSLETGSNDAYKPARGLYKRYGFTKCPPFADYVLDEFSICMSLEL